MKKGKTVGLWILSIFFILSAIVYFPSFFSLISILIVALVIPISRWQTILNKYIKGKLKLIIVIILSLVTIFTVPNTETNVPDETTATITTEASTDSTVASTSESTTAPTIESTTTPTTESATDPTTIPTTKPTTAPTTEPNTAPTTEPTTAPTTEPPHTHSFSSATCTAPKTCSCGATEGEANGHNWKDATYTSPKTCTVCGTTEGTSLDVPGKENYHGHVYTGGDKSTKYHYEADCAGKYSHEITWEEVDRRGLEPCGTCVLK